MKFDVNKIFNKENAKHVAKFVGTIFLGYCAVVAKTDQTKNQTKNNNYIYFSTYSGAINAIMNSTMYSFDKTDITKLLLPNASEDYYSSVISIANSTMFSSDKVYAIKSLNKTFAENTSAIVK